MEISEDMQKDLLLRNYMSAIMAILLFAISCFWFILLTFTLLARNGQLSLSIGHRSCQSRRAAFVGEAAGTYKARVWLNNLNFYDSFRLVTK